MTPVADRVRCASTQPDYGFRCFLAYGHESFQRHVAEIPDTLRATATTVYYWGPHKPSEFPVGSVVLEQAIQYREDARALDDHAT